MYGNLDMHIHITITQCALFSIAFYNVWIVQKPLKIVVHNVVLFLNCMHIKQYLQTLDFKEK